MIHQPVFMVSQCLLMPGWWLASGDQHRLMRSGSTSEALRDDVLNKYTVTVLYYNKKVNSKN